MHGLSGLVTSRCRTCRHELACHCSPQPRRRWTGPTHQTRRWTRPPPSADPSAACRGYRWPLLLLGFHRGHAGGRRGLGQALADVGAPREKVKLGVQAASKLEDSLVPRRARPPRQPPRRAAESRGDTTATPACRGAVGVSLWAPRARVRGVWEASSLAALADTTTNRSVLGL